MSTKEFIKKQVENFSKPLTPEQFSELSEAENSLIILEIPPQGIFILYPIGVYVNRNGDKFTNCSKSPFKK